MRQSQRACGILRIVAAMGYELSQDVLRAARLSDDLRESQQRMALATGAANLGIRVRDFVRNEVWATDKWRELLVPANVPVSQFWAVTVYNLETSSFFPNSTRLTVNSLDNGLSKNADGSVDI
jgi:Protein of unknown function (DUF1214)